LFATEQSAMQNLKREGIPRGRVHFTGNTMIDSLLGCLESSDDSTVLRRLELAGAASGAKIAPYALLTLHRPANVDDACVLQEVLEGLKELAGRWPIIFPVHPRTRQRIVEFKLGRHFAPSRLNDRGLQHDEPRTGIVMVDPLGYLDFLCLMRHAQLVITDSGGIQEETTCLKVPCVTVRNNTERPITILQGTNVLAGTSRKGIRKAIERQLRLRPKSRIPAKWDGKAAGRIVNVLVEAAAKRTAAAITRQRRNSAASAGDHHG
jgi:UDP-N-acetylglucosamine 2-epimerase (non-hydrolysing)